MTHFAKRAWGHAWLIAWMAMGFSVLASTMIPTTLVYRPTAVQITGSMVRVHRVFPLDGITRWRLIVSYLETVTADDGRVCSDSGVRVGVIGAEFVEWDIGDWAAPCMSGDFVWSSEWTALAFGVFPLRPVSLEIAVFDQGA